LHGDDVVRSHAKAGQSDRNSIGESCKLPVGEPADLAGVLANRGQRELVRANGEASVEVVIDRAIVPISAGNAIGAARGQKNGIERRDVFQTGTAAQPARLRAMMVFMIWVVPSPHNQILVEIRFTCLPPSDITAGPPDGGP
jgi:hypothetical protein